AGAVLSKRGSGNFVKSSANFEMPYGELRFTIGSYRCQFVDPDSKIPWSKRARVLNDRMNRYPFHPWWDREVEYDFRAYQPGFDLVQTARWSQLLAEIAPALFSRQVGDARGLAELRTHVADWLNKTRGLECSPEE